MENILNQNQINQNQNQSLNTNDTFSILETPDLQPCPPRNIIDSLLLESYDRMSRDDMIDFICTQDPFTAYANYGSFNYEDESDLDRLVSVENRISDIKNTIKIVNYINVVSDMVSISNRMDHIRNCVEYANGLVESEDNNFKNYENLIKAICN